MRLNALYRSFKVLVFLIILVMLELAGGFYNCIEFSIWISGSTSAGCLSSPPSIKLTLVSWISASITSTIFFVMTMAKLFNDGRWRLSQLKSLNQLSPLLHSFFRDGAVFYFLIFAALVSEMIVVLLGMDNPVGVALNGWLNCIYSVTVCRLILNLREAAHRGNVDTDLLHSLSLSTWQGQIVFSPGLPQDSVEETIELGIARWWNTFNAYMITPTRLSRVNFLLVLVLLCVRVHDEYNSLIVRRPLGSISAFRRSKRHHPFGLAVWTSNTYRGCDQRYKSPSGLLT